MASRTLIVASFCLLAVLRLTAAGSQPEKINGLLNNSPFGTSRPGATTGTGTGDPLEFRSVLEENGSKLFSIYDTATHRSTWVEMNDPVNGFSVKGYDAAHDTVTVEFHEKSLTLPIKRAPAVAQAALPPPMPGGNGSGPAALGQGPMSPIDQQRLQQVQEEIRRRRALRQMPAAGLPPGGEAGPRPMPVNSAGGAEGGPRPTPINPNGAQTGPQLTPPNFPNLPSGPQPQPVKN